MNEILRRLPDSRFSEVLPLWENGTAVLIGGGPSLTIVQVERVRAAYESGRVSGVLAVNDAYRVAPWADVCYFADSQWWEWHHEKPDFRDFLGQKCSIQHSGDNIKDDTVHILRSANTAANGSPSHQGFGLSLERDRIVTGRHSGFQALNLAVLAGAKDVILLGYDAREPGVDGRTHWFGEHPTAEPVAVYAEYRMAFSKAEHLLLAAGVKVLNCSPGSAINSFPKVDLEQVL